MTFPIAKAKIKSMISGIDHIGHLDHMYQRPAIEPKALQRWHACVEARSPAGLDQLLAEDVIFHSPVVYTPQHGKPLVTLYLAAALQVLGNDSFRYTKQIVQHTAAMLEFESIIEGVTVNGVDIIVWNDQDQIIEFKVMIRPLKAVNLLHQHMATMLESLKKTRD
jgi:hypothetical protein